MKITCKFCDWTYEFRSPVQFNEGVFQCGAHYARCHDGMIESLHEFDTRLEEYALLPDTREEIPR